MEEKREINQEINEEEEMDTDQMQSEDPKEQTAGEAADDMTGEDGGAAGDSCGNEGAESAEDSGDAEAAAKGKGGFFKKKEKKDKKDEKIEELTDRVKRQMAEFDNFRKRTEREKSQMFETGAKSIIEKILPVIDNFERGLATVSEEDKGSPFAEGMEKIYKQMLTMLEEAGVKPIEAQGKEFDPNLHNAVMHIDDEEFGENIVVEEFQKGYMYRDSVVRHSMVKVAN